MAQASLAAATTTAANEIVKVIVAATTSERGAHAETAIAAAARLAGTCLVRTFRLRTATIAPGTAVLSEAANEYGPRLNQVLAGTLQRLQVPPPGADLSFDIAPEHQPHWSVTETQERVEAQVRAIAAAHHLTPETAAYACAIAAALLIKQTSTVLDPQIGIALAVFGFAEGSKTMPIPLPPGDPLAAPRRPWYKFW